MSQSMFTETTRATLRKSNFLGCGYDVTGLYCHPNGVRANVIDMPRLLEEKPERFEKKNWNELGYESCGC